MIFPPSFSGRPVPVSRNAACLFLRVLTMLLRSSISSAELSLPVSVMISVILYTAFLSWLIVLYIGILAVYLLRGSGGSEVHVYHLFRCLLFLCLYNKPSR